MQYKDGTVSIVTGSTTVTGVGTLFKSSIGANRHILFENDNNLYNISSVTSDTILVLSETYTGETRDCVKYAIVTGYTPNFWWPLITRGDENWPAVISEAFQQIDNNLIEMPEDKEVMWIQLEPTDSVGTLYAGHIYYCLSANELRIGMPNGSPVNYRFRVKPCDTLNPPIT